MDGNRKTTGNTKLEIARACLKLLESMPADKITVRSITSACHVSRQTFYYHFQDIYEVFEFILEYRFRELEKKCIGMDHPRDAVRCMLQTGLDNRAMVNQINSMQNGQMVWLTTVTAIARMLRNIMEAKQPDLLKKQGEDADLIFEFFAGGIYGYMSRKLATGEYDVDRLTEQLCRIMFE